MAVLTVFYSRADENYFNGAHKYIRVGNTERVAQMVAEITGSALFKLEQVQPYAASYDACVAQARQDLQNQARPALKALPQNWEQYDEIYLGYPNYCGTMPMAVYTFLEALDFSGKVIHPFCTHEGGGLSHTEKDIQKAAPGARVTNGLAVHGSAAADAKEAVSAWIASYKS